MEDKNPPYQFFPCNFYKRNNLPQNFLTFSFDPFAKVMWSLKATPLKKIAFLGQILMKFLLW